MKTAKNCLTATLLLLSAPLASQATGLDKSFTAQPYLDTSLGGTTSAARPELAGTVLEDDVQTFSFLGITGTVQNRVVREDVSGTLDFYWRIKVDEGVPGVAAPGAISAFRLGNFDYESINDGDWRIDGLGSATPYVGRVFNSTIYPDGDINFLFTNGLVTPGDDGSKFFFLHTDATSYAKTATYDLLNQNQDLSSGYSTFAPYEGVPDAGPTSCMLLMSLAGLALGVRR